MKKISAIMLICIGLFILMRCTTESSESIVQQVTFASHIDQVAHITLNVDNADEWISNNAKYFGWRNFTQPGLIERIKLSDVQFEVTGSLVIATVDNINYLFHYDEVFENKYFFENESGQVSFKTLTQIKQYVSSSTTYGAFKDRLTNNKSASSCASRKASDGAELEARLAFKKKSQVGKTNTTCNGCGTCWSCYYHLLETSDGDCLISCYSNNGDSYHELC